MACQTQTQTQTETQTETHAPLQQHGNIHQLPSGSSGRGRGWNAGEQVRRSGRAGGNRPAQSEYDMEQRMREERESEREEQDRLARLMQPESQSSSSNPPQPTFNPNLSASHLNPSASRIHVPSTPSTNPPNPAIPTTSPDPLQSNDPWHRPVSSGGSFRPFRNVAGTPHFDMSEQPERDVWGSWNSVHPQHVMDREEQQRVLEKWQKEKNAREERALLNWERNTGQRDSEGRPNPGHPEHAHSLIANCKNECTRKANGSNNNNT